ncbi:TetR/AcrR family transcriptional regulator [Flagellimonas sp. HMM57]|uniref:TetR/AcrR family transcriptional regulator n=1 Tax=unclassified Flagellimonas TaxID=2644544 RepID=UPI0013D77C7D|nr:MULTISPECIES: TetR/AcrR family transcriptional regulator [unclassified Flagellimonas]UII76238.1 TetR/AcrR family transcriptional regulator [Flagellimonas sp. HMM57]
MRPQKVLDIEILKGLTKVFRSKGYEGASLKELSEATGLKKASLYHRFPNGKQEMADAVLNHLGEWIINNVFQSLLDDDIEPQIRLKNGLSEIRTLYNDGKETCIFRALSMQTGIELFEEQIKKGMNEWLSTFKEIGMAFQLNHKEAEQKALQVLIEIQGSLIVTKGIGDISIFENTIKNIEHKYINE